MCNVTLTATAGACLRKRIRSHCVSKKASNITSKALYYALEIFFLSCHDYKKIHWSYPHADNLICSQHASDGLYFFLLPFVVMCFHLCKVNLYHFLKKKIVILQLVDTRISWGLLRERLDEEYKYNIILC